MKDIDRGSRKPDFLILGAQKCGTTWLGRVLSRHPEVFVAHDELHYFDKKENVAKGDAWYESQFSKAGGKRRVGEKTPDYFWPNGKGGEGHDPDVHRHIKRYMPDGQFLLILRDPVRRAISAVNHLLRTHRVSPLPPVDDYLVGKKRHLADAHGVIDYGFYQKHLDAYLELFDRKQFLVLIAEEATVQPAPAFKAACSFLGVADFSFSGVRERVNAPKRSKPRLAVDYYLPFLRGVSRGLDKRFKAEPLQPRAATIETLRVMYADENERLYKFLGRRPEEWL